MNGLMTEQEWRRKAEWKCRRTPPWWGPQCMRPAGTQRLKKDPAFRIFLVLLSCSIAVMLPVFVPRTAHVPFIQEMSLPKTAGFSPRMVKEITYTDPVVPMQTQTFSAEQLKQGRMLLLDETHLLPEGVLPPNTFSIADCGRGMVPVTSLSLKSGRTTIEALVGLFDALRKEGAEGLAVYRGSTSPAQQQQERLETMRSLMKHMPIPAARGQVLRALDEPASGEMLQEHAVEIRLRAAPQKALETTMQGQKLLQLAWRHGFVRTDPCERPFRFRYVGRAHATAMTYLDVDLPQYLQWLHHKGTLAVSDEDGLKYLILCKPAEGSYVAFSLPQDAEYEVSMDNMGYAIAACTF